MAIIAAALAYSKAQRARSSRDGHSLEPLRHVWVAAEAAL